jgi:citrate synthase
MSTTTVPTTGAGLEGVVAAESEICFIDGFEGILSYRGYNIHTLAEHATFEEVIWLLWKGKLPTATELEGLKAALFAASSIPQQVVDFLIDNKKSAPMDVLRTAVSMLSLYDPLAKDMSPEANQQKAINLMARTSTIVSTFGRIRL